MIKNEIVTEATEYILHNIGENLTLENIAAHCHVSVSYLSRLFGAQKIAEANTVFRQTGAVCALVTVGMTGMPAALPERHCRTV